MLDEIDGATKAAINVLVNMTKPGAAGGKKKKNALKRYVVSGGVSGGAGGSGWGQHGVIIGPGGVPGGVSMGFLGSA